MKLARWRHAHPTPPNVQPRSTGLSWSSQRSLAAGEAGTTVEDGTGVSKVGDVAAPPDAKDLRLPERKHPQGR